jgi:hypothetical protein
MQFIPSTWSIVGVDADGDGRRNPQDINDAALATAVYLCSGTDDLATTAGQRAAVFRYNHSASYVATVLQVMTAYLSGDYTSVPNSTVTTDWVFQHHPAAPTRTPGTRHHDSGHGTRKAEHHATGTPAPSTTPSSPSQPSTTDDGGTTKPSDPGTKNPGGTPTTAPPALPSNNPVTPVLATTAQLVDVCTSALTGKYGSAPDKAVTACVNQLTGKTLPQAQAAVGGVVVGLADLVKGLLGGLGGLLGGGS